MSDRITIPPESLEAAAIELYRSATHSPQGFSWATVHPRVRERWRRNARAACLAMLEAWQTEKHKMIVGVAIDEVGGQCPAIILPLPQKETSE